LFAANQIGNEPGRTPSSLLIVLLTALGTFLAIVSFPVKRKFFERSVEKQDVTLVQKGLVIACAMCELSALLGLLERFLIGKRDYYLLFLIAAAGTAFHFPRRDHLLAATYKAPSDSATS
jgi:NADH:ubiquinone oxidoreductase subunit 2 (subunit N)